MRYLTPKLIGAAAILLAFNLLPHAAAAAPLSCTVTSPTLAFGSYDSVTGAQVTSTATFTVSCKGTGHKSHSVTVALSAGSYGSFAQRKMQNTNASDTLNYNLYTSAAYTTVWGDGSAGTSTVSLTTASKGNPATVDGTVYGVIPANRDPSGMCPTTPCAYSDSVVITVTF